MIAAAGVLICLAAAYAYLTTLPVTYTASSTCYVSMATGTSVNDSYEGGLAAQQRVRSYVTLATSDWVALRVKGQLGLPGSVDALRSKLTASSPPATMLIVVTATDGTAVGAREIADQTVSQFRALVDQLETIQRGAAPAARVAVVDPAVLPTVPSGPKRNRILMLGLVAGLIVGGAGAFGRERLDRRLHTSADVAALLPVPILGIIDHGRPGATGELRRLRTRLAARPSTKTVLLTSLSKASVPDVGIGLARSLADTGAQVVLVDADTTGHGGSACVPDHDGPGLAGLLGRSVPVEDALVAWPEAGFCVLPLGDPDSRTPDLLANGRFTEIMSTLRDEFDHVVVQVAPVTAAADAIAVSAHCDATLGVVELGPATSTGVSGALATLGEQRLSGAVVCSRPRRRLRALVTRTKSRRSVDRSPTPPNESPAPEPDPVGVGQ